MKIQILGSGCAKCKALEGRVRKIIEQNNISAEIEKVTDLMEIGKFGIMMTPGLVIDGVVKSAGSIPKDEQILEWMKGGKS